MIPRSARRSTRRQSRNLLGSVSFVLFTAFALLLICPVAVNADEEQKARVLHCHWNRSVYISTSFFGFTELYEVLQILLPLTLVLGQLSPPLSMRWKFRLTDVDSVQRGGRVEIIANDQNHHITPS